MKNFIEEYQLEDTTLCDSLLDMFWDAHEKGLTYPGKSGHFGEEQSEVKKSTDFSLESADQLGPQEKYRWNVYNEQLTSIIDQYLKKYEFKEWGGAIVSRHLPQLQWYKPGEGFYKWHVDGAQRHACDRILVYMTYLNDIDDGGGTMFYHQDYTVTPKKGKTVIFPAGFTHQHKGEISNTQDKFILTGWLWWQ